MYCKNLPRYKRDGLMTWYEQGKCKDFLEDTDGHFRKSKIINFDIIDNKNKILKETLKKFQTVEHKDVINYPRHLQTKIFEYAFRTGRRDLF